MAGSPRARKALQGVLVGLAAGALALGLALPGLLDAFEGRTWDWRVRLLARPGAATERIALIVLDQASLDWGQEVNGLSWPWPRERSSAAPSIPVDHRSKAIGAGCPRHIRIGI